MVPLSMYAVGIMYLIINFVVPAKVRLFFCMNKLTIEKSYISCVLIFFSVQNGYNFMTQ